MIRKCCVCSRESGGLGINSENKDVESWNKDHFILLHDDEHETR